MTIIQQPLDATATAPNIVRLAVERSTLAKRRWRGMAEDGAEFGFDLARPLADGAAFHQSETARYVIAQKYEPVLEIRGAELTGAAFGDAARLGWMIGNLHFQIEIADGVIRVADDSAVRQLLTREGIAFAACKRVFHPLSGGHRH